MRLPPYRWDGRHSCRDVDGWRAGPLARESASDVTLDWESGTRGFCGGRCGPSQCAGSGPGHSPWASSRSPSVDQTVSSAPSSDPCLASRQLTSVW